MDGYDKKKGGEGVPYLSLVSNEDWIHTQLTIFCIIKRVSQFGGGNADPTDWLYMATVTDEWSAAHSSTHAPHTTNFPRFPSRRSPFPPLFLLCCEHNNNLQLTTDYIHARQKIEGQKKGIRWLTKSLVSPSSMRIGVNRKDVLRSVKKYVRIYLTLFLVAHKFIISDTFVYIFLSDSHVPL